MSFVIEKGIPLPGTKGAPGASLMQALRSMDVGDSFLLPKVRRQSVINMSTRIAGFKLQTRTVDAENVRVWRIA